MESLLLVLLLLLCNGYDPALKHRVPLSCPMRGNDPEGSIV